MGVCRCERLLARPIVLKARLRSLSNTPLLVCVGLPVVEYGRSGGRVATRGCIVGEVSSPPPQPPADRSQDLLRHANLLPPNLDNFWILPRGV